MGTHIIKVERYVQEFSKTDKGYLFEPDSMKAAIKDYVDTNGVIYDTDRKTALPGFIACCHDYGAMLHLSATTNIKYNHYYIDMDVEIEYPEIFSNILVVKKINKMFLVRKTEELENKIKRRNEGEYSIDWDKMKDHDIKYVTSLVYNKPWLLIPFKINDKVISRGEDLIELKNELFEKYLDGFNKPTITKECDKKDETKSKSLFKFKRYVNSNERNDMGYLFENTSLNKALDEYIQNKGDVTIANKEIIENAGILKSYDDEYCYIEIDREDIRDIVRLMNPITTFITFDCGADQMDDFNYELNVKSIRKLRIITLDQTTIECYNNRKKGKYDLDWDRLQACDYDYIRSLVMNKYLVPFTYRGYEVNDFKDFNEVIISCFTCGRNISNLHSYMALVDYIINHILKQDMDAERIKFIREELIKLIDMKGNE